MNKLIVIILLVYSDYVFCQGIIENQEQQNSGFGENGYGDYDGNGRNWIGTNKKAGNWLGNREGQIYRGVLIGSDKNVQGGYDKDDDRYGQNGDDSYENNRYDGRNRQYNDNYYDNGGYNNNGNRYGQGIRIGINGYIGNNQYNDDGGLDRYDRYRQRGQDRRADLLLNAGLRAGAGLRLNAGLRTGLGLNAGLRAALGLNALGVTAGLSLDAGLRVGLDLSLGGELSEKEDLVRPCLIEDYQCIRKFFAENSQCRPSYGPTPDPLYLDQNTLFLPNANLSYTLTNVKITGIGNAKISDLYLNRVTGNVVLSIQIKDLNETSAKAYVSYKRVGKEPIILADASSILFANLRLTVVLPSIPNLRLDLADIHAYIDDGAPQFKLGPGAYNSKDPEVAAAYLQLSSNLQLSLREGLRLQAQLLAALFLQLNICDFGINLISY